MLASKQLISSSGHPSGLLGLACCLRKQSDNARKYSLSKYGTKLSQKHKPDLAGRSCARCADQQPVTHCLLQMAVYGNFSGHKAQEIIVSRGSVLELLRPDEAGHMQTILTTNVFGEQATVTEFTCITVAPFPPKDARADMHLRRKLLHVADRFHLQVLSGP